MSGKTQQLIGTLFCSRLWMIAMLKPCPFVDELFFRLLYKNQQLIRTLLILFQVMDDCNVDDTPENRIKSLKLSVRQLLQ